MTNSPHTAQDVEPPQLVWNKVESFRAEGGFFKLGDVYRAKVPGGWFVLVTNNARGLMFYPDPEHIWDGGSLTA